MAAQRGRRGSGRYSSEEARPDPSRLVPAQLYEHWLTHLFGEVAEPARDMDFLFDAFVASDDEIVGLFALTMDRAGADLDWASDEQVTAGLYGLFDPSWSSICHRVMTVGTWNMREVAIRSIAHLYSGLFAERCSPALGHLSEPGTAINTICYMLWDASPLGYWGNHPDREAGQVCVADVMRGALAINHDACRESALHGLGHLTPYRPDLVEPIVDDFLRRRHDLRPELVTYARQAACGRVQ